MARRLASLFNNVGRLRCDLNCLNSGKVKSSNVHLCDFQSLKTNREDSINEQYNYTYSEDLYKLKNSYGMCEYYINDGNINQDIIYSVGANEFSFNNNVYVYDNNKRSNSEKRLYNVTELEDEVIVDKMPCSCLGGYKKKDSSNNGEYYPNLYPQQHNIIINTRGTVIDGHNKNNHVKKIPSHLYSEIVNESTCNHHSFNDINDYDNTENFLKEQNKSITKEKQKEKKNKIIRDAQNGTGFKNRFFNFSLYTKGGSAISNSSHSNGDRCSDASSEFLSVISSAKSNI
ncbi:conserved Plasmodium protein, unknown function [Plasmodium malariae]|uniref:Uncharacterized protein n=1 Tax=Plasmodium malariae TaxID=5858 RepID=A0A1C3KYQ5_PLAMA|nr:conserved Plasmodium protein, unknown function [Plasmodium malariae]